MCISLAIEAILKSQAAPRSDRGVDGTQVASIGIVHRVPLALSTQARHADAGDKRMSTTNLADRDSRIVRAQSDCTSSVYAGKLQSVYRCTMICNEYANKLFMPSLSTHLYTYRPTEMLEIRQTIGDLERCRLICHHRIDAIA